MTSDSGANGRVFSDRNLLLIFVAGVVGEIVLEFVSWGVIPEFIGRPMRPDILVSGLSRALLGYQFPTPVSVGIHVALGAIVFPLIYLKARLSLKINPMVIAVIIGVSAWLIAQSVLAPTVGRPIFLDFVGYTWASLGAHISLMVAIAITYERLNARFADRL